MLPALQAKGIKWPGWHAFRRGLATQLHDSGVDDKTIQHALRHSDIRTTQGIYIKRVDKRVTDAANQWGRKLGKLVK